MPEKQIKVIYCTADYFIDESLPIVHELSKLSKIVFLISIWGNYSPIKNATIKSRISNAIHTIFIQRTSRRRSLNNIWGDVTMLLNILKVFPDIVFIESVEGPYFIPFLLLLKILRIKFIIALHDVIPHSNNSHWMDEIVKKVYIHFANKLVVYSRHQAIALIKSYNKTAYAIALPYKDYYEKMLYGSQVSRENNTILFFGTIRPNKGLENLILAAEIIRRTISDLKVIIAGFSDDFNEYAALMKTPEIYELHIERIKDEDVGTYFLRSQMLVLPYHDATQSGPVLISYSFGCPVIAPKTGGLPEYVVNNKTGLLINNNAPEELAENIMSLLNNQQHLRKMQEYVVVYVRDKYNVARIAKQLQTLFMRTV